MIIANSASGAILGSLATSIFPGFIVFSWLTSIPGAIGGAIGASLGTIVSYVANALGGLVM